MDTTTLAGKPVLIGATGGTARHSLVIDHAPRPLFAFLCAHVTPTAVYAASQDWGGTGDTLRVGSDGASNAFTDSDDSTESVRLGLWRSSSAQNSSTRVPAQRRGRFL